MMAMAKNKRFDRAILANFEEGYETSHEDAALQNRGEFIRKFPLKRLKELMLDEYVVGHQEPTFCNFVENKTRAWANIQGATSRKFGLYFGRTKSDPTRKYRFTEKFGRNKKEAFASIRNALIELVRMGSRGSPDFATIDQNPLSQMFKAKILSLYFPKRFLAVCSSEHLEMLGSILGFPDNLPNSRYQNLLLKAKQDHSATAEWSNPKFMAFLYKAYVRQDHVAVRPIGKPRKKSHRLVDFEDMQKQRGAIGKAAEEHALRWERERLSGAGLKHLVDKIEDLRNRPGHGHDFLSYTSDNRPRFIEVKSVAKLAEGHRFFLSDTERQISLSTDHAHAYYFYLVFFDGKGHPADVVAVLAEQLYRNAELTTASYAVRFDLKHSAKNH
jgi:hypothetical protein